MAFNIFATATSDIPLANLDANFTLIGAAAAVSTLYPTASTSITYGTAGTTHYLSGTGLAVAGAATVGTTLGVTGTSTMAAINASGNIIASNSNLAGIASGVRYNASNSPMGFLIDNIGGNAYLAFNAYAVVSSATAKFDQTGNGGFRLHTSTAVNRFDMDVASATGTAAGNITWTNVLYGNATGVTIPGTLGVAGAVLLGTYGVTNGILNTGNSMRFNIDSTNTLTGQSFQWGTNTAASSGGTVLMTLLEAGNLGVNVVPSAWVGCTALEVGYVGNALIGLTGTINALTNNVYYDGAFKFASTGYGSDYEQNGGGHYWKTSSASGTAGNTATMNTLMTLSATGILMLNGASANGLLAILGRSGYSGIYVQRSNTAASFAVEDDGNIYAGQIGASTGTALILSGGYIKTLTSSRRYKKDEEPIDIGLDFINTLKPIKFRLKENDLPQVGFIAEDFPDERLVDMSYIDIENKELGMRPESVHYSQITAPLVKAVQELSAKVAALEAAR